MRAKRQQREKVLCFQPTGPNPLDHRDNLVERPRAMGGNALNGSTDFPERQHCQVGLLEVCGGGALWQSNATRANSEQLSQSGPDYSLDGTITLARRASQKPLSNELRTYKTVTTRLQLWLEPFF